MKYFRLLLLLAFCLIPTASAQDEPYRDSAMPIEARVEDLLARMSLEEKIGQMTLVEKNSIAPDDITGLAIGGLLSGGGGYPQPNTPENWAAMVDGFQEYALATPLGIPLIYGVDAVHGHNNVFGATIFPHNIGLGATRNPQLVAETARITALEMAATGIFWNYAPVVAVPQDIRWGRTYEGFSEDTVLVTELATAYLNGLQGEDLAVLGTPKHFVGDGGAVWGSSTTNNYALDQGVTDVDEETLRAVHLPPYQAAVQNGALSIMISFSSWGGMKMHAQQYLITDVLKGELGFSGFVVSDWGGIDQISPDYAAAVVTAINAGVDMNMVPYDYRRFIGVVEAAVERGDISLERIDDAVRRILRVKFALGLFEQPFHVAELLADVGSAEHRAVAREAVSESLVLLKNEGDALPLPADLNTVFVVGTAADDIGLQNGGWTIEWQGVPGDSTIGTTMLEAVEASVSDQTTVIFSPSGRFRDAVDANGQLLRADVAIVVLAEAPYAEGQGDREDLNLPEGNVTLLERVRERADRVVVILLSGRPLIINDALEQADAFVAAWLPGTEGLGVTDALFGYRPFTGTLPHSWPASMDHVPLERMLNSAVAPLFPFGFGLTTTATRDFADAPAITDVYVP
ncbi:MAG: glycoside hydrolase family 3 C-terminal domain-containing protein [Chloroflexi bacterium]|nr:glycoside hydrolase family 3 C-terminal domain-containing protein [Chloroflexota bacterium]